MTRVLLLMLVACAPKSSPPVPPVPAEILPEEGSICESERGVPVSDLEAPTYRVYSLEELREGFSVGARFRFEHSPMDAPTPRPAFVEEWVVTETDESMLTVQIKTGSSAESLAGAEPQISSVTWETWGAQWTFPSAEVEIQEAACTKPDGESITGVQIRQRMQSAELDRIFEYCFAAEGVMPPVSLKIYDFGTLNGMSTLSPLSTP